jgi:hypothetical protein
VTRALKKDGERTGVFTRRAWLMLGGQIAVLGALGTRLFQVQVREGARYTTLADENRISTRMIRAGAYWTGSAHWSPPAIPTGAPCWSPSRRTTCRRR